ncbi:NAD(P)-dependent oxidoreductase [Amycolatopsis anabasis]|uniref:NAD(P)-dependent oxidoreductase n=1 Tax=Amycolatopsis anabasis TaxID=1840409 RepID=UPI00131B49E0|nr:NAD(P)-binding domain-containing protein [Amycolatopsis anabasis]
MQNAVSLLGLGRMGSALARLFVERGCAATVWNRTAAKTVPLAELGARVAPTAGAAVQANPTSIVCVDRYAQVKNLLSEPKSRGVLAGRTIVNLTWGTPEEAWDLRSWVVEGGAQYLDGAILDYPSEMGTGRSVILYAGERAVFDVCEPLLSLMAEPRYGGADPAWPNALGSAVVPFLGGAVGGFLEGAAYAHEFQVSPRDVMELLIDRIDVCRRALVDAVEQIEAGDHATEQASAKTFFEAAQAVCASVDEVGHQGLVMSAFCELLEPLLVAGKGDLAVSAVYDQLCARYQSSSDSCSVR